MSSSLLSSQTGTVNREALAEIVCPGATPTHKPIPHIDVVNALVETLGFRQIAVVREAYGVSNDGMRMFGVLDLDASFEGCRFSLGIRNANDKSFRLALTVGYRVFVCDNMAFRGDFTPVLAKHSKNFNLIDSLAVGVERMQRHFDPMRRQVEGWRQQQLSDGDAKGFIYEAFIEDRVDAPKHLARVIDLCGAPHKSIHVEYPVMWSGRHSRHACREFRGCRLHITGPAARAH